MRKIISTMELCPKVAIVLMIGFLGVQLALGQTGYQTDYNSFGSGNLDFYPGLAGQDGYYDSGVPGTYSLIEATNSISGKALLQVSPDTIGAGGQTGAGRQITSVLLASNPVVTLSVNFYADSSDLSLVNPYSALAAAQQDGVGAAIQLLIGAGNGTAKSETGLNVLIAQFNGSNNNYVVSTTVGRNLAWKTWHQAMLVVDYSTQTYVSLSVDGQTESLTGIPLPRVFPDGTPTLPTGIDSITQQIVANPFPGQATTDKIYWDNFSLTGSTNKPALSQPGYQTDYDSFNGGLLAPFPGVAGQDGFYDAGVPDTYSLIESTNSISGKSLLQVSPGTIGAGGQTIAERQIASVFLATNPIVTLSVDFYADSSDLSLLNPFTALAGAQENGVGTVIQLTIGGGNGTAKSETGLNVSISQYNGSDNNFPASTTVGRNLAWDSWHHATLVVDYSIQSFVSLTVDGQTESLAGILLPRAFPPDGPELPTQIDSITQQIIASPFPGQTSTDKIYWDNFSLTTSPKAPAIAQAGYQTDYNLLSSGTVFAYPGLAGQDGYYNSGVPGTYSLIEATNSISGKALLQVSPDTVGSGVQTAVDRRLTPVLLASNSVVTLSVNFYADSSDLSYVNPYSAFVGGQQDGVGTAIQLSIGAGNGTAKSQTGLNVLIAQFNGSNNNYVASTTVGRNLAWNTWHQATLVVDYATQNYVSLSVDGQTESLTGIPLPRGFPGGTPTLPTEIDSITQQTIASPFPGQATTDKIYWDNFSLTASPAKPVLHWGKLSNLDHGIPLGANQLNATANVPGTFAYSPPLGALLPLGTNILTAVFTPSIGLPNSSSSLTNHIVVVGALQNSASGSLFYTTYGINGSGQSVGGIKYNYVALTSFSFSDDTTLTTSVDGAGGITITGDGQLAVGAQGTNYYKINRGSGAVLSTISIAPAHSYQMMSAPDGAIWTCGQSGSPATGGFPTSFNSTLTGVGTSHPLSGDDLQIDALAWATADSSKAFYVSRSGVFGKVDLATGVTTRLLTGIPAANSIAYDYLTKTLILVGGTTICQIDRANPTVIKSQLTLPPLFTNSAFSGVEVDGAGHVFVANRDGTMTFLDISGSGLVGASDFVRQTYLHAQLSDLVPLALGAVAGGGIGRFDSHVPVSESNKVLLSVIMKPAAAAQALAGWRLSTSTNTSYFDNSSVQILTNSNCSIEFKSIPGWVTPSGISLTNALFDSERFNFTISYSPVPPVLKFDRFLGLGITGTIGTVYQIQRSSSLAPSLWTPFSTNTITATGFNLLAPPAALTNQPAMFYRALWLQ